MKQLLEFIPLVLFSSPTKCLRGADAAIEAAHEKRPFPPIDETSRYGEP